MFRCTVCKESVGPNVKPIFTTAAVRPVEYKNTRIVLDEYEREHKEEVRSIGTEIISQDKCCPKCAGVVEEAPVPTPEHIKRLFAKRNVFEERLPEPLRPRLVALAVHSALERTTHASRRAKVELEGTVPTIKQFVEHNPKLVF